MLSPSTTNLILWPISLASWPGALVTQMVTRWSMVSTVKWTTPLLVIAGWRRSAVRRWPRRNAMCSSTCSFVVADCRRWCCPRAITAHKHNMIVVLQCHVVVANDHLSSLEMSCHAPFYSSVLYGYSIQHGQGLTFIVGATRGNYWATIGGGQEGPLEHQRGHYGATTGPIGHQRGHYDTREAKPLGGH